MFGSTAMPGPIRESCAVCMYVKRPEVCIAWDECCQSHEGRQPMYRINQDEQQPAFVAASISAIGQVLQLPSRAVTGWRRSAPGSTARRQHNETVGNRHQGGRSVGRDRARSVVNAKDSPLRRVEGRF